MKKFLKWAVGIFVGLIVLGFIVGEPEKSEEKAEDTAAEAVKPTSQGMDYTFLSESVGGGKRWTGRVEIEGIVSEDDLLKLTDEVRDKHSKGMELAFVEVKLKNSGDDVYYAVVRYSGNDEANINRQGVTPTQFAELVDLVQSANIDGQLIGAWVDDQVASSLGLVYAIALYEKDGGIYLQEIYPDTVKESVQVRVKEGAENQYVAYNEDEEKNYYYGITDNGWLTLSTDNGVYYQALPLDLSKK